MKKKQRKVKAWAVAGIKCLNPKLTDDNPWNYRNQAMIYKTKKSAKSFAGCMRVVPCIITYTL